MTKAEYEKAEKVMEEAIRNAKQSNSEFEEMNMELDWDKRKILESKAQNHFGYAEGINQALVSIGFKHERMKELAELL